MIISLRSFKRRARHRKVAFRRFLRNLQKNPPRKLDQLTETSEREVWKEINCLSCANCCKTMTPTYKPRDIKRISLYLGMTVQEFKDKWLYKQKSSGDWLNRSTPCQFLDLQTNMCTIYEVRPEDCADFPHIGKKRTIKYLDTHKQNVAHCPATYRLVEKMMEKLKFPASKPKI